MMKKLLLATAIILGFVATSSAQFATMGIRGSATSVGWDGPNDIMMTTTDGVVYTLDNVSLVGGGLKFRQNNEWPNNWGGATFPDGVGIFDQGGVDIPVVVGVYDVTFNLSSLQYNFVYLFPTMGMRGSATPVGWDGATDLLLSTTDGVTYTGNNVTLADGGLKFRENNEWPNNWGGTGWPSGVGIFDQGGVDIPVQAGTYNVTFNRTTLEYDFVSSTLSIANHNITSIKMIPNPTSHMVNFDAGLDIIEKIQVSDMSGKIIITQLTNSATTSVDVSSLPVGIYITVVTSEISTQTIRMVKY